MKKQKKFSIVSLGCPKNTVDSEILKGGLLKSDFTYCDNPEEAEVVVVNTCGFIEDARQESIDTIIDLIELKRSGTVKQLLIAGCMSERYEKELRKSLPEVDKIYGVNSQQKIISDLTKNKISPCNLEFGRSLMTPGHYAYLKIAEGCDNQCSFCSIPLMRGKQISRSPESIIKEAVYLNTKGVKELILIAQDLTRYGTDLPGEARLPDILEKLLSLDLFPWVRLLYNNPDHWSPELNCLFRRFPKLLPYTDIPIQHASDKILKSMNRGKGIEEIRKILKLIRDNIPNVALRTSIIVGFPGETEDDFSMLQDFIEEVRFERLGVFTYSEEEDTPAAELKDDVPAEEKEWRKDTIMGIQWDISREFALDKIGKEVEVLIDRVDDSFYVGRTVWDAPEIDCCVKVNSEKPLEIGEIYKMKIDSVEGLDLVGKVR